MLTWPAYPGVPSVATVPGHGPRLTHSLTGGRTGGAPVQVSGPPSAGASATLGGTVPVVTVVSSTTSSSCTRVARAVDAVRPVLSQVTSILAGASFGTRRKCALVATGC